MRRHTSIGLIALLLSACQAGLVSPADPEESEQPIAAQLSEPFWLGYRESAELDDGNLRVRFQELAEDSRCPSDVVCVWEGRARIAFDVWVGTNPVLSVELGLRGGQEGGGAFEGDGVETPSYRFRLRDLTPYPISVAVSDIEEYSALLWIDRRP